MSNTDFIKHIDYEIVKDTNKEYHSKTEYYNGSGLKKFKQSPAHYKYQEKKEPSEALIFGSAYHSFIYEPDQFEKEFYCFDDSEIIKQLERDNPESKQVRRLKEYQDWKKEYLMNQEGKQPLTDIQMMKLKAMKKALFSHPYARSLFKNGEAEISIYCEITINDGRKIKVKIRPDYFKRKNRIVADLKTAIDASAEGFQKNAANFDYHISAALYKDILDWIYKENHKFYFVAQEKVAPYAFNLFQASNNFISQGRYEYEMLMLLWADCDERGEYPGYQIWCDNKYGVNELNLPPWSVKEINYFNHD